MISKKLLITIVIIIIVLIAGALLWRGGFFGKGVETVQPGVEGQTSEQATGAQTETGSIGKMTDEILIEITAQMTYYGEDPESPEFNNRLEKLLNKYGVNIVSYGSYIEALTEDISHATVVAQKSQERILELQQTGGK